MVSNQIMCTCCVDSRPLHFMTTENSVVCLASGHVYEKRGENWYDSGLDSADYQRRENYYNLEFPDGARPNISVNERIDLSRYSYS